MKVISRKETFFGGMHILWLKGCCSGRFSCGTTLGSSHG